MSTPEELLCSRKWRILHSLWMILGWVPLTFTAWIGYLIIGIRARNWKWIALAVSFLAWIIAWGSWSSAIPQAVSKYAPSPDPVAISIWGMAGTVVWLGNAIFLQWWINRKWLVWRAHHDKTAPWYATATQGSSQAPANDPRRVASIIDNAFEHGTADASLPQATPSPIDVNVASSDQLATLPGFDASIAAQVVAARNQAGGFKDTADLVTRGGVKPHVLAGLQGKIFVAGEDIAGQTPPISPPLTSPEHGRRLEF